MILAHALGGWQAIRGPGPISWQESRLSLQHMAEERIGGPLRRARAIEDAIAAKERAEATRGNR